MTNLKLVVLSLLTLSALSWFFLNRDTSLDENHFLFAPPSTKDQAQSLPPLPQFSEASLMSPKGPVSFESQLTYTLIPFWASWCYPCWEELSTLNEIQEELKETLHIKLWPIGVAMDGDQIQLAQKKWKELELHLPLNYELEGFYQNLYKIEKLPYTILIENKNRKVVKEFRGSLPNDDRKLLEKLEASLSLEPN